MTTAWVILPTYDERENLDDRRRPRPRRARELRPAGRAAPCCRRRRLAGRDRRARRPLALEHARRPRPAPRAQGRPRRRLPRRLRRGARGGADFVIEMDADLSHDPADLPRLIDAARHGADVVLGSRYVAGGGVEGWPLHRQLISRAGGRYAATVLGLPLSDLTGGFKCFRASALRGLDPRPRPQPRLRVPDRADLPRGARRAGDRGDPDRVPRARARALQDVAGDRARGDVARPAPAHGLAQHGAGPQHPADGPMTAHLTSWIADLGLAGMFALMAIDAVLPAGGELVMLFAGALAAGAISGHPASSLAAAIAAGTLGYLAGLARRLGDRARRRPPVHRAPRPLAAPRAAALPPGGALVRPLRLGVRAVRPAHAAGALVRLDPGRRARVPARPATRC